MLLTYSSQLEGGDKWGRYSIIGLPCRTVTLGGLPVSAISVEQDGLIVEQAEADDPSYFYGRNNSSNVIKAADMNDLPVFAGVYCELHFGCDAVFVMLKISHLKSQRLGR